MEILNSIILGIIQGVTEFLPISSSGHLILFREFFSRPNSYDLAFDAVLQLATTFAILVYFRQNLTDLGRAFLQFFGLSKKQYDKKILNTQKTLLWAIILGTIPAIVLGLILEGSMETIFRNSNIVALSLIFGSIIMLLAEFYFSKLKNKNFQISKNKSIIIGLFQSLALIPGMSRSGMTISGGLFVGLDRELAVRFSFLLSIPILLITGFKKFFDLIYSGQISIIGFDMIIGSITAFLFGIISIHFLITFLRNNSLKLFIFYRLILAAIILFLI
ncbi:MAG TPA: undecaprenyl-diphosphatase UppP [Candidatus Paceibacterota bacterium]|nr:undecaprenyl-diphosphatase UppP [Candidatus Paceibacterota bacterium]HMP18792.1 undecaprenyl-diphosphatase UppP [Candidatus Paceibacterota bacterium]HMP85454.1 undecaprenyl-diphosphatase UppP [Candidatus Paceibacterota bacterium]